jgi:hypothetical protein
MAEDFLLARVADDEAEAVRDYHAGMSQYWLDRRVRTCDVRRRVVDRYQVAVSDGDTATARTLLWVIGEIAAVYDDHPDFATILTRA